MEGSVAIVYHPEITVRTAYDLKPCSKLAYSLTPKETIPTSIITSTTLILAVWSRERRCWSIPYVCFKNAGQEYTDAMFFRHDIADARHACIINEPRLPGCISRVSGPNSTPAF
jgi:hypothetical protein